MQSRWRNALLPLAAALTLASVVPAAAQTQPARSLYDPNADARAAIAAALAEARARHKLVILDFGADWCLDCWILERLYQTPQVAPYLDEHFTIVRIDVGQFDRNLPIVNKYGRPIEGGVPAVVVLAPTGQILATTRDGSLESARRLTPADLRRMLEQWVDRAPRS